MIKNLFIIFFSTLLFALPAQAQVPGDSIVPDSWSGYDDLLAEPGTEIGEHFAREGELWYEDQSQYGEHPWREGNPESSAVWQADTYSSVGPFIPFLPAFQRMQRCFEPRMILPICPLYCNPFSIAPKSDCAEKSNTGWLWAFWWPENVVEVNDFGISAVNPAAFGRSDLLEPNASEGVFNMIKDTLPDRLNKRVGIDVDLVNEALELAPDDPQHKGRTKYAGITPPDQSLVTEAHIWKSYVHDKTSKKRDPTKGQMSVRYKEVFNYCLAVPFWYNGYKKGNHECFYSALPKYNGKVISLFTENPSVAQIWRYPEMSLVIAGHYHRDAAARSMPGSNDGEPIGLIADGLTFYGSYVRERSCNSYRLAKWPEESANVDPEVLYRLGVVPNEWPGGEKICYKGGGQLFPLTGTEMGMFSPLPAAAYFARRALYLAERMGDNQTNIFSDYADKLQRVFPGPPSECFKMNDVNEKNTELFPPNLIHPEQKGSIRYMYWNMRVACTCQYRGTYPLPFLLAGGVIPQGEGCHAYRHSDDSRGDVEGQKIQGQSASGFGAPWPYFWPLLGYTDAAKQTYCDWGPPGISSMICSAISGSGAF